MDRGAGAIIKRRVQERYGWWKEDVEGEYMDGEYEEGRRVEYKRRKDVWVACDDHYDIYQEME